MKSSLKVKKFLKCVLFIFAILIGIIAILIATVASNLMSGLNIKEINELFKYTSLIDAPLDNEVNIVKVLIKINEYSNWILTGAVMWLTSLVLLCKVTKK